MAVLSRPENVQAPRRENTRRRGFCVARPPVHRFACVISGEKEAQTTETRESFTTVRGMGEGEGRTIRGAKSNFRRTSLQMKHLRA